MLTASLPDPFYSDALCPGNDARLHFPVLNMNSQGPEHTVEGGGLTHSLRVARCQCSTQIWTLQKRLLVSDTYRPMVTTSNARIPY
jgi:hypothetical protein